MSCHHAPARGVALGRGPCIAYDTEVEGGEAGILLDGRGRPIVIPATAKERVAAIEQWIKNLDLYPVE